MDYYKYATTILQEENIENIKIVNKNIENTNILLVTIIIVLILQFITSFIRNIF